ncbi:MAG: hypothetical protein V4820_20475 [Pseudomonadota bacterium]
MRERLAPAWRREARRGLWANLGIAAMVLILLGAVAVARHAEGPGPAAVVATGGSA